MDKTSTPAKKPRKSPFHWTSTHKLVLERIILKGNGGTFPAKLAAKNRDVQNKAWSDIIFQFRMQCGMIEVDRKSIQGLWQRMRNAEKAAHDKELLNLYKATRATGGGPGPSQLALDDPDELMGLPAMASQSDFSGMSLSQNSPLLTPWNPTSRVRDLPHTITSSAVPSGDQFEIVVPVSEGGESIFVGEIASTDVGGVGEQENVGDDLNQTLPDPEANTAAPVLEIEDNDPKPQESFVAPTAPIPTSTAKPSRAPKRPNAATKAVAYVDAADHTKEYWSKKMKMEEDLYNAQMRLADQQMKLSSMKQALLRHKLQQAGLDPDHL